MSLPIKTSQVTEFLKFLIDASCSGAYSVDDDGYITVDNRERAVYGSPPKNLIIYKEKITDREALIINPLAEGHGRPPGTEWFYRTLRTSLATKIALVIKALLRSALAEKNKDKSDKSTLPLPVINAIAPIVNDVDDKLIAEFDKLVANKSALGDFMLIQYSSSISLSTSVIFSLLSNDEWDAVAKFRKSSVKTIKTLLMHILDIQDVSELSKFTCKADAKAPPKVSSWLGCLFKLYQHLNPLLAAVNDELAVNLGEFRKHMDLLVEYADNAKFMLAVAPAPAVPQSTGIPAALPAVPLTAGDTRHTQHMVPGASSTAPAGMSRIPGAMRADGQQMPDTYYYNNIAPQSIPGGMPMNTGMYGGNMGNGMIVPHAHTNMRSDMIVPYNNNGGMMGMGNMLSMPGNGMMPYAPNMPIGASRML